MMNDSTPKLYNVHAHERAGTEQEVETIWNKSLSAEWIKPFEESRKYSIGIHPYDINSEDYNKMVQDIDTHLLDPQIAAIGECGLDARLEVAMDVQLEVFRTHIEWAECIQRPLIIHCVRAYHLLNDLKEVRVPVIFHGVNVRWSIVESWVKRGTFLSYGAAILRDASSAQETFMRTPLSQIFLETDDTDVEMHSIYEKAAELKQISIEEVILQVQKNFLNVFNSYH